MPDPSPQAAVRLTITEYEALRLPDRWVRREVLWHEWCTEITGAGVPEYLDREAVPLVGLYSLADGATRGKAGLTAYYGLALDFDAVAFERVSHTAKALEALGVSYMWHTTWSHGLPGKGERRRILVPLAEPLHPDAYRPTMARVRGTIAPDLDVHALQTGQAFFVPSTRPGVTDSELFWVTGRGLALSDLGPAQLAVVGAPRPEPTPPAPVALVDVDVWRATARRLRSRQDPRQVLLGQRLEQVCDGLRFAQTGERDSVLWQLASTIVRLFPDVATDSVSQLFKASLHRMAQDDGDDCLTDDDLREKVERARASQFTATTSRWHPDRHEAIRQAFGSNRTAPYTDAEVDQIRERFGGVSEEVMRRLWVMQAGREYYLVGPEGRLVSCQREAFDNVARVMLSPAPIDLHKVEKEGRRQYTRQEILEAYSTPLESVGYSLIAQSPEIDLQARTLTLPACPRRALAPAFDARIDRWFRLLAGPLYDTFLAWLSHVPDLSRPLAALVLTGPKSVGKGLLAMGISRLWTTAGPTALVQAMARFNAELLRCPYCSADEGSIPRDASGAERTEDLRSFIQETVRPIDQKNRDLIMLQGATRLQISANNDDILALAAGLSANDIDAIAARFFHVPAAGRAKEYLEEIGGWAATDGWVAGDGIARHVLWLHEHLGAAWEGRFGVDVQQGMVDRMLVRNGVRSQLCEICVRALKDPSPLGEGAQVVGGSLMVTLDWVLQAWGIFLRSSARQPTTAGVIRALDGLSTRVELDGEGWFVIDSTRLVAWGSDAGAGTKGKVTDWLSSHEAES